MTTPLPAWTLMSREAPVGSLTNHTVSLVGDTPDAIYVIRVTDASRKRDAAKDTVTIDYAPLGSAERPARATVPSWRRLDDFADEEFDLRVTQVVVVPGSALSARRPGSPRAFGRGLLALVILGTLAGIALAVVTRSWWLLPATLLPLFGLVALLAHLRKRRVAAVPSDEDRQEALAREEIRARLTPAMTPGPAGPAMDPAHERIASIKDDFGRLAGDIVYRIESSALFDASVPTTHQFQLELLRWDDDSARLGPEGRNRLSFEVALAFRNARENAERVGLAHLPTTARPGAERAIKVARLATSATTPGERQAAASQLGDLLDDLALHYLPKPVDVPRMLALHRTELEATHD